MILTNKQEEEGLKTAVDRYVGRQKTLGISNKNYYNNFHI